jgi:twitching motility protein PilJ
MAKAQAVKKSSFADWFKKAPKAKPAARPGASAASSTLTNIPVGGGPVTRPAKEKEPRAAAPHPAKAGAAAPFAGFRIPLLADKPIGKQLQVLAIIATVIMVLLAMVVFDDTRSRTQGATQISILSQMQFHTQRLAKAAGLAARGQANAFPQLADSRDQFADYLAVLRQGGTALGVDVPSAATNDELASRIEDLSKRWPASSNAASAILSAQKDLIALAQNVEQVRLGAEDMASQGQELIGLMSQAGTAPQQVLRANRITALSERLGRGAAQILGAEIIDPEVPFLLGKDTNEVRAILQALESGNPVMEMSALRDAEARAKLAELKKTFGAFEQNASPILRELTKLVSARQASAQLIAGSEQLQAAVRAIQEALQQGGRSAVSLVAIAALGVLLVGVLALMAFAFVGDSRRSAADAERENKRNQEAILRLLNEMGDLADGDLTIRAQVTEDITGAIADSMNYTIDELRTLVAGVNNAAIQVTQKTAQAQSISAELLGAAEKQSREIEETTAQVLQVSRSIADVSSTAEESARVAQRSLAAADKGRAAVQNSISGMNDIREQIQETSKRIKRLGESSQEIGEIVELISDITEQTNVLALNAAIQAASAGEAGRGFSVVAEEVQRLAERSGEATKQIGAIVKTIQADTQDAVAAMEKSTQGVVEGAKLSDAAGQALTEIDSVTKNLATLIGQISQATHTQANATNKVAQNMQDILEITRQTTRGTQQAAGSIRDLATVAQELKSSVSGFKL